MKRLHSEIDSKLKIHKPRWLPCDVCKEKVFSYHLCTSPFIFCSMDCLEILVLSQKNGMLHEDNKDFNKIKYEESVHLMIIDGI